MEIKEQLNLEIERGFSKTDLEKLIGLPKNFLSGFLKGNKKLSKKAAIKTKGWLESEKPNPLEFTAISKLEKLTNIAKNTELGKKVMEQIKKQPTSMQVRDIKSNGEVQGTYELSTQNSKETRIKAIRAEKIPEHRNTPFGRKSWNLDQQNRILAIQNEKE